ncbi:MAG: hypothetical protein QOJ26_427 [Thermoplasmata archaeon]|nr:hypothetical protein [Thermoplasmata archaeon]MEA3165570.1 hypothetical protein [Thermoplasmata archaeon]
MAISPELQVLRRRRGFLASLSLAATGAFVVALLMLHIANIGHEPIHMSQFANSRFGLLWALAVYTFIVGGAMLVWALRPQLSDCPSKKAGLWMLGLAGIAAILLAAFPADETFPLTLTGEIHDRAALTAFVLLGASMVVLAPAFRSSPSLGPFASVSLILGLLVTLSWATYLAMTLAHFGMRGLAQRTLVAFIVTWFVLLALRLLRRRAPLEAVRRLKAPA